METRAQGSISVTPTIVAFLKGAYEIPPNNSTNAGQLVVSYDSAVPTNVTFKVYLPLSFSNTLSAAIYGPSMISEIGPLLFDLGQSQVITQVVCVDSWPQGMTCSTNTQLYFSHSFDITPGRLAEMNAGAWYGNIKTLAYPEGELRGQITPIPVLDKGGFKDQKFSFKVGALPYSNYTVESSSNFVEWSTLTNVYSPDSLFQVVDPDATNSPQRFYRVRSQ